MYKLHLPLVLMDLFYYVFLVDMVYQDIHIIQMLIELYSCESEKKQQRVGLGDGTIIGYE